MANKSTAAKDSTQLISEATAAARQYIEGVQKLSTDFFKTSYELTSAVATAQIAEFTKRVPQEYSSAEITKKVTEFFGSFPKLSGR